RTILTVLLFFFSPPPPPPATYPLSLHDALPISAASSWRPAINLENAPRYSSSGSLAGGGAPSGVAEWAIGDFGIPRSGSRTTPRLEEHTSELQSRSDLVCRLLLEKKKKTIKTNK